MELNIIVCPRLGTMLYPNIQKRKEEMNKSQFKKETGGTVTCIERLIRGKKRCVKI